MTEFEELVISRLDALQTRVDTLGADVETVRDVVRGWRGQLVKQGGLVAIAIVTALGHGCASDTSAAAGGAGGSHGASGEGGAGGR